MGNRNVPWVLAMAAGLLFCLLLRFGMNPYVSLYDFVSIASLGIVLILAPDRIAWMIQRNKPSKWHFHSSLMLFVVMGVLTLIGLSIKFSPIGKFTGIGVLVTAGFLVIIELSEFLKNLKSRTVTSSDYGLITIILTVFTSLMILINYSSGFQSPLFFEKILSGTAHRDILFHAGISGASSTYMIPTMGLHALTEFKYHWGSHMTFGGLAALIDVNSIVFYNIAYPVIFIPLFFKYFFRLLESSVANIVNGTGSLVITVLLGVILWSSGILYHTFWSESTVLAFIFSFAYVILVLEYIKDRESSFLPFFLFSLLAAALILASKISNGLILIAGFSYLYLRTGQESFRIRAVYLTVSTILLYLFFDGYLYLDGRIPEFDPNMSFKHTLIHLFSRYQTYWLVSFGVLDYMSGILLFLGGLLFVHKITDLRQFLQLLRNRESMLLETILVMNISALLFGIYASGHARDVQFFMLPHIYFSVIVLLTWSHRGIMSALGSARQDVRLKWFIGLFLLITVTVSRPEAYSHFIEYSIVNNSISEPDVDRDKLQHLIIELESKRRSEFTSKDALFIPPTEGWYYDSQSEGVIGSPFVAPAVSGLTLIGGVPEKIFYTDFTNFGFGYFLNKGNIIYFEVDDAADYARSVGFDRLFVYRAVDGEIDTQIVELHAHNN